MEDASCFIGNPYRPGTGPGKIDIITAAKLSGKSTSNFAGLLSLKKVDGTNNLDLTFFSIDQV